MGVPGWDTTRTSLIRFCFPAANLPLTSKVIIGIGKVNLQSTWNEMEKSGEKQLHEIFLNCEQSLGKRAFFTGEKVSKLGPRLYGEKLSGIKGSLSYPSYLIEPTFPPFPYKTWRTVYMRNKKLARIEGWTACRVSLMYMDCTLARTVRASPFYFNVHASFHINSPLHDDFIWVIGKHNILVYRA